MNKETCKHGKEVGKTCVDCGGICIAVSTGMPIKTPKEKIEREFVATFAMNPESCLHSIIGTDLKKISDFFFSKFSSLTDTIRKEERERILKELKMIMSQSDSFKEVTVNLDKIIQEELKKQ